jgi:serine/threonine protein kinase
MSENNQNCSFILKNYNECKNKCTKELQNIPYCTRHYNKLLLEFNTKTYNNSSSIPDNILNITKIKDILNNIDYLKKFNLIEYINSGTYIDVYKLEYNNQFYALKYQDLSSEKNMLYYEYLLLSKHFLDNNNIVKLNSKSYFYKNKQYALLLMEYIDTNFEKYLEINNLLINNLEINNLLKIKKIVIDLINTIKYIHDKRYLYIDLKPDNIMFLNNTLKLIDFNLCVKYIDSYSKYYPNDKLKARQGNDIYSSRNINSGFRGVRIDDIESILYILLDILNIDEFKSIKQSKQIKVIIDKKKYLFNQKFKYNFINEYIIELNKYINNENINNKLQNKIVNYNEFIKILS